MLERFTKAARLTVAESVEVATRATAGEVRPEHLLRALIDNDTCLAVRVLDGLGAPAGSIAAELDRRRMQYVDGLDADDAEALQAIGIDLDEVVRRIDQNLGGATTRSSLRARPSNRCSVPM